MFITRREEAKPVLKTSPPLERRWMCCWLQASRVSCVQRGAPRSYWGHISTQLCRRFSVSSNQFGPDQDSLNQTWPVQTKSKWFKLVETSFNSSKQFWLVQTGFEVDENTSNGFRPFPTSSNWIQLVPWQGQSSVSLRDRREAASCSTKSSAHEASFWNPSAPAWSRQHALLFCEAHSFSPPGVIRRNLTTSQQEQNRWQETLWRSEAMSAADPKSQGSQPVFHDQPFVSIWDVQVQSCQCWATWSS